HDLDPRIVTLVFAQLVFDLGRVSDQIELVDLFVIVQGHNGTGNEVRRAKITAHRVEGDLHQGETLRAKTIDCKAKFVTASLAKRGWSLRRPQADGYSYLPSNVRTWRPR